MSADQAASQANNNANETTGKSLAVQGDSKEQSVASACEINVNEGGITAGLAALPPAQREQLIEHPEVREKWVRERLAEKLLVREAQTKGWAKRSEIARDMQIASEQVLLRSYLQSVSKVPEDYPSKAELTAAYERASAKLQIPARFHLRQIFYRHFLQSYQRLIRYVNRPKRQLLKRRKTKPDLLILLGSILRMPVQWQQKGISGHGPWLS